MIRFSESVIFNCNCISGSLQRFPAEGERPDGSEGVGTTYVFLFLFAQPIIFTIECQIVILDDNDKVY